MTHCAKCGAELIGSRKFCAACGTPAGDPRSPAASTGAAPVASGRLPSAPGSAPASSRGGSASIQYAPSPASQVNPFAQTAGPATSARAAVGLSDYGPPPPPSVPHHLASTTPGVGDPSAAPQVSPLAVSNVASDRGAFERAITADPESARAAAGALYHPAPVPGAPHPADAADPSSITGGGGIGSAGGIKRSAVAGTQMMPSIPQPVAPSGVAPSAAAAGAAAAPKRQDRTQLLGAFPGSIPRPGMAASTPGSGVPSAGTAPVHPPSAPSVSSASPYAPPPPIPQPPTGQPMAPAPPPMPAIPQPVAPVPAAPVPMHPQPLPVAPWNPPPPVAYGAPVMQPPPAPQPLPPQPQPQPQVNPYASAAPYMQPPMQAPMPPPAPPGYGFGFAYTPGSRVNVTWSNGQRYPGTVQQVSGSQCLVVFPDGQHHWVEMQYVAPA